MNPNLPLQLLGGLTPRQFLDQYWQKKPLLVRQAVPGYTGLLTRDEMFAAACRDDVESRLVLREGGDWDLRKGPFTARDLRKRKDPWTVLLQGVNLFHEPGDALVRQFDFIPYARLDDLMASYAVDGGGVGPHFDSYDVFLLQGMGKRRWRIGAQKDQTLVDGLPVRILKNFKPTLDFTLEPGDMLYLPPQWAHDGVAVGECTTWSIGFRAIPAQDLAEGFLAYLQEKVCLKGRYADPELKPTKRPAEIGPEMVDQVIAILDQIKGWKRDAVQDFLGEFLTEPKHHVFFDPPEKPLAPARFAAAAVKRGVKLDVRTKLLFAGKRFYLNGEAVEGVESGDRAALRELADRRELAQPSAAFAAQLHAWYCDGFIHLK
jgi:50S ribosomal protein L16 3-hydroxylase